MIFGAVGDLTWRKLVPALYNLWLDGWLPRSFAIIGVDGKEIELDPFLHAVLVERWEELGGQFQDFLAANGLSSHLWAVARLPAAA